MDAKVQFFSEHWVIFVLEVHLPASGEGTEGLSNFWTQSLGLCMLGELAVSRCWGSMRCIYGFAKKTIHTLYIPGHEKRISLDARDLRMNAIHDSIWDPPLGQEGHPPPPREGEFATI